MLADLFLQRPGSDVLAAGGDQQVLLAAGDGQETVLVEGPEVAGAEEPVHKRLRVGCGVVVVALEDADALDQDLAVLGDPDGGSGHRDAHRAHLGPRRRVGRARCRGFGEAVAFEDGDAGAAEEVRVVGAQRAGPGDGVAQVAAEGLAQLGVQQPVEEGVPGAGHQPGTGPVPRAAASSALE